MKIERNPTGDYLIYAENRLDAYALHNWINDDTKVLLKPVKMDGIEEVYWDWETEECKGCKLYSDDNKNDGKSYVCGCKASDDIYPRNVYPCRVYRPK